jgi:hypothetical protein
MKHFAVDLEDNPTYWFLNEEAKAFFDQPFEQGEIITYSQRYEGIELIELASRSNLHLMLGQRPCELIVVRRYDVLAQGSWVFNLYHLNKYSPTFGTVTEVIGPMAMVRCYDRNGNSIGREPLERRYLAKIAKPIFPISNPCILKSGRVNAAAVLHLKRDRKTELLDFVNANPLLCRALDLDMSYFE